MLEGTRPEITTVILFKYGLSYPQKFLVELMPPPSFGGNKIRPEGPERPVQRMPRIVRIYLK